MFGFFKSEEQKKKELRPLSEKDIRGKLYGEFQSPTTESGSTSPKSSKTLSESEIQKKLYGSYMTSVESDQPKETYASPKPLRQDLFEAGVQEEEEVSQEQEASPNLFEEETEDDSSDKEKIRRWSDQENKITEELKSPKVSSYQPIRPANTPIITKPQSEKQGVGWAGASAFLMTVFSAILGGFVKLFSLLQLKSPAIRRVFYWLAAIAILAGLLLGIHHLNVQRENAIKAQKPKAPAATAKDVVKPEAKEAEAAAVQEEVESAPAVAAAEAEEAPARSEAEAVAEVPSPQKPYVIQVATYVTESDAAGLVEKFKKEDVESFVKRLGRPGGRYYFSVFLGRYESYHEAQQALSNFKQNDIAEPFQDAFVRTMS